MRNRLIVSKTSIIAVILFLTQFVTLPYFAWYNVLKYIEGKYVNESGVKTCSNIYDKDEAYIHSIIDKVLI